MTDEPNTDIQATNGQFDSIVVTGEIASDTIQVEQIESERNTVTDQLNVAGWGKVLIKSNGHILASGITTSNNGFMFGSEQHYLYQSSSDTVTLRITSDGPYAQFKDVSGDVQMGSASGTLRLSAGGNEKFRITTDGNVNIGVNHGSNPFSYLRFGASNFGAADIRPTDEANHKVGLSFYTDGTQDENVNPTEKLRIKCTGAIGVGTTAWEGTSGQVLTSLGSDSPTWRHTNAPAWFGRPTEVLDQVIPTGAWTTLTGLGSATDAVDKSHGGWNPTTGVFTVPSGEAGIYHVWGGVGLDDLDSGEKVRCGISKNDVSPRFFCENWWGGSAGDIITTAGQVANIVELAEGDTVRLKVFHNEGSGDTEKVRSNRTYFGGYRLSA